MMAISEKHGSESVVGQLRPDVVRMTGKHLIRAIAQMSAQACARRNGPVDLLRVRRAVSYRDQDSFRPRCSDVCAGSFEFWCESHDLDKPVTCVLPPFEFVERWKPYVLRVVRTSRTVIGGYGGPLHMHTSDRVCYFLIFATRLRDCRETVKHFLLGRSNHGWKVGRHALRPEGARQLNDSVGIDVI